MSKYIENDNQLHLQRFKNHPPHPSYIAGFIDGDGCIFIRKIIHGYQSGFCISQCRTNILQIVRYHFGGSITSSAKRNDKTINIIDSDDYFYKYNIRNQYNLSIRNNEYEILLDYLKYSFIIKEKQYQLLCDFNKIANSQNKNDEKEQLHLMCAKLNEKCHLDELYIVRLNNAYIAGLFDAEGCFYIDKKNTFSFRISLAQKNHPFILNRIVHFLGFGKLEKYELKIYKKEDCLTFIQLIKPHLIVKYNQACAFESFLTTTDRHIKEEMYAICNREKHEIELFTELNQNTCGKEGYFETVRIKELKEKLCKEIHNKHFYVEKSEKMKGEGNHNFGKTFSDETRKKMSCSIREAKGGVSDEVILNVRKLIEEGNTNIEIQKILSLPKHTVTRIKNGDIVCRNEEKKDKVGLTQIEINLSKRKITTDEIITVIEKLNEKWKPNKILEYLVEYRIRNNILNSLTIDIVKNIKRNLTNGKSVIYESELSPTVYEYYNTLVNNFAKMTV